VTSCVGCSCQHPHVSGTGSRVLLSTRVSHNLVALRSAVREVGEAVVELAPGLLEVHTSHPSALLTAARRQLSSVEAAEVRAVVLEDEEGDALLSTAFAAPTLAEVQARVEHADLLPMFADELSAFRSVYQPIVTLGPDADRPVIGYEALLRGTGPKGPVMPVAMFHAAGQAGWLHVLDRVGRTTALRDAAGWLGEALLFVNFLPTTIYRPQVCLRTTERAAELAGLRLDQLVFEVTEAERVTDIDHLSDVFAYYRERGCKVALDDLGAGYSSLNMLVRLQPDFVKLDKEIVQRLPEPVSRAVVAAVVEITHAYGGKVLAECVETAEQASAALELGVDLGQGWLFGRPEERPGAASQAVAGTVPSQAADALSTTRVDGNDRAVALCGQPAGALGEQSPGGAAPRGSADVEALVARAVDLCTVGVTIADATRPDLPLIYVNQAFEEATGYLSAEVLGRNCRFLQGPETDPDTVGGLRDAVTTGRDHVALLRNYRKDGRPWWNEMRLSAIRDHRGRVTHYFGFQNDVTARVDAEQRVAHLAYHDALTGLPNRAQVVDGLVRELARAERAGRRVALLFIDLDDFKAVNDRLGHAAGDLALTAAGARLRGALRDGDLLGRHSGDEFLAVLTDVPRDQVTTIAQRAADAVTDSFHSPLDVSGHAVQLGACVGVALFPDHGRDATELLQAADRAMYAAKATGRGRAVLARPAG